MPWPAPFRRWLDRWFGSGARVEPAPSPPATAPIETPRAPRLRRAKRGDAQALGLALQGGGAHGAFTWGVLDRLLDEPTLVVPAITGASAGALNGAMLVAGHADGGRAGAQKALAGLWDGVGELGALMAPLHRQQQMASSFGFPGAAMVDAMMRMWSPSQLNPFNLNPLRDLVAKLIDVDALRAHPSMRLYVAATSVETGTARIFSGDDLSIDALMASACLPLLYEAVTIDGVAYWDGGYSANPPLGPLLARGEHEEPAEILLVQINPDHRAVAPTSSTDILDRVGEITFNASLLSEMRLFDEMRTRDEASGFAADELPRLTRIAMYDAVADATAATKASLDAAFHRSLRDHGRRAAEEWLSSR